MKRIIEFIKKHEKLVRYIIAGCCTTLFNLVIFTVAVKIFDIDITISNISSVVLSIIFAYVINKIFVFKSKVNKFSKVLIEAFKFISARSFTMLLEVGGVYLLVNILGQNEILGKAETQALVFIFNYIISKHIVFRNKKMLEEEVCQ